MPIIIFTHIARVFLKIISQKVTESLLSNVSNPSSSRQIQKLSTVSAILYNLAFKSKIKIVGTRLEIELAGRQLLMVVGVGYLLYIVSDEYNINAADSELIDD